jgi:hypothetical protein
METQFAAGGYDNLRIDGFYWNHENMEASDPQEKELIRFTADYLHSKGYHFIWIPFYMAAGFNEDACEELQSQTGIPVVSIRYRTQGFIDEGFHRSMRVFAEVVGAQDRCEEVLTYVDACKADLNERTKDIAATLGAQKGSRVLVGFAMETENEQLNAQGKLERKNFDFIVLNSLRTEGAGFRGDTNVVTLIDKERSEELPLMSKREVAERIVDKIENFL